VNTSTRASYANADQCHASTASTPLLRPYGLVMPQVTSQPITSQWEGHPNLHCQAIANEYQWALDNEDARLPVTPQLLTDARVWLRSQLSHVIKCGYWPDFVNRESLLSETLDAFSQPTYKGVQLVPITNLYNDDPHPVWSPLENLLFRFVHDYHHHITGADSTFSGELTTTRHILTPEVRKNDALARFLASEPVGQSSLFITSGIYPKQIIARNILTLI